MTTWHPDLSELEGPLYVRLAKKIETDIESGTLPAGTKLPPQRNLAFDIGVTIGTVGRAYAQLRERGLVHGEVGRGTFVSPIAEQSADGSSANINLLSAVDVSDGRSDGFIAFDTSAAPADLAGAEIKRALAETVATQPEKCSDYIRSVSPDWRIAGARWIATGCDWQPEPATVIPVHGTHAGIMAVIAAMTNPGDKIACEALTYNSIPRSGHLMGRRAVSIRIDDEGIVPEAFENVCAQQHPKILFLMPSLHNPTAVVLSTERRRAIVDIARRHNVWLIEDNVYGSVSYDPNPPLAALAPDITFHIAGLSKSVSAGLRAGWIACPGSLAMRVLSAHKLVTGGDSFILTDTSARLINSGGADDIRSRLLESIERRNTIVSQAFRDDVLNRTRYSPFVWLKLPEPWLSGTFKNAAHEERIRIDDEDEFKSSRSDARFHGVRIAFSLVPSDRLVEKGAQRLKRLLDGGPTAYHSYN